MQMNGLMNVVNINQDAQFHFTNQTGFALECPVARELARSIERASSSGSNRFQMDQFVQNQHLGSQKMLYGSTNQDQFSQHPLIAKLGIQIRWEKSDSGEQVEPILYGAASIAAPLIYSAIQLEHQQSPTAQNRSILRQVRQSDGALIFEPFSAQDFRPDVHLATYRCIASSQLHGASLMSGDFRLQASIRPPSPNLQGQLGPEVMDELVIEGNDAHFKCQIPAGTAKAAAPVTMSISQQQQASSFLHQKDQFQVLDWIEYPSEQVYSVQSTTQSYATTKLFARQNAFASSLDPSQIRYFVAPQSGDLHILQVDSSLNYRSFRCRIKNKVTGEIMMSQNKAKLIVTESHSPVSPRLQLEQPAQSGYVYMENQLALLACNGQAYPRAQIVWSRLVKNPASPSEPISMQPIFNPSAADQAKRSHQIAGEFAQIGSLLLVNKLQRNHSGIYVCQAINSAGEERLELELLVRAPLRVKLTTSPASVLELGKSLALDCTVTGYPVDQIVFRHNLQVIKTISGSSPSSSSHSNYKPQQQQQKSLISSAAPGYLVVDETPQVAKQDSSSQDDLAADSWSIQASDSQQPVSMVNKLSHVIVIVLEPQHTGAYQCVAQNNYGETAQSSAYIRVLDDPPKFKDLFRAQVYEQHQDISLQCSARANPLPEITWSLDDAPLPESGRIRFGDFVTKDNLVISYVNISSAEVADTGSYKCIADNGLAAISHEAQISVSGPLQVKPMSNITVLSSSTFRVRCPVAGYPITEIQWFHNERRLPTNHRQRVFENGTLEIEHMEKAQQDHGLYSCLAIANPSSSSAGNSINLQEQNNSNNKQQAYGSVNVTIKAKPTIAPFAISNSLREGERATVSCTVSSGDLPIEISWFRNQQAISASTDFKPSTLATNGKVTSQPLSGLKIIGVSEYSSTLVFESLSVSHSGNYTCLARNEAGQSSHTSQMIVQVAPKWSLEPVDSSVTRGGSMAVDCGASGYPPPRIIWTKASLTAPPSSGFASSSSSQAGNIPSGVNGAAVASSSSSVDWSSTNSKQSVTAQQQQQQLGSWRSIVSSPHLQVFENGSLNLLDARDLDQGYYMCQASNGVGPGLSKVIKVTVNVAAQFSGPHHSIHFVVHGDQAQLRCQVRGDWPISLHWFRGRNRLEPINPREPGQQTTSTTIIPAPSTQGNKQSETVNNNNNNNNLLLSSSIASVLLVPGSSSPSSWSLAQLRSSSASNSALHNNNNNNNQQVSMVDQLTNLIMSSESTEHGDHQNNEHLNEVGSHSQVVGGAGLLTPRLSIHSTEQLVSSHSDGHTQMIARELRAIVGNNNNIQRVNLQQQQHQFQVQLTSILTIAQADRSDTNAYKCLAANNFGIDERTIQLIVQDKPDKIEEISFNESHSRTIILGWLAPHDGNSPITNYHIQYKLAPEQHPNNQIVNLMNNINLETLHYQHPLINQDWLNYSLPVSPGSQAGYMNYSTHSVHTQSTTTTTTQTQAGASTTSLHNNNSNNKPSVLTSLNSATTANRAIFKVSINLLKPLTRYWFRVSAENKLGLGQISRIFEAATLDEAPSSAPDKVKAIAQSSSTILVSWSRLPDKQGDLQHQQQQQNYGLIQGYYVAYKQASDDNNGTTPASAASSTTANSNQQSSPPFIFKTIQQDEKLSKYDALITGLKRSSRYLITVQPFNAQGTGPSSEPILVRTLDMDPPRQVKLRVKQATNCSLELEWRPLSQAAVDVTGNNHDQKQQQHRFDAAKATSSRLVAGSVDGDADQSMSDQVDYYVLFQAELSDQPRWTEIQVPGSSSSFQITNLRCGTRYQFYMLGVNRIGRGEQSEILDTKTAGGTPILPDRQSCFEVINATCYMIRLDAWQENRCPIKKFLVQYRREMDTTSVLSSSNNRQNGISNDWINLAQVRLTDSTHSTTTTSNSNGTTSTPITNTDSSSESNQGSARLKKRSITQQQQTSTSSSIFDNSDDANNSASSFENDLRLAEEAAYIFDYSGSSMLDGVAATSPAANSQLDNMMLMADYVNLENSSSSIATAESVTVNSNDDVPFSFLSDSILPAFEAIGLNQAKSTPPDTNSIETINNSDDDVIRSNSIGDNNIENSNDWLSTSHLTRSRPSTTRNLLSDSQFPSDIVGSQLNPQKQQQHLQSSSDWRKIRLCNLVPNSLYTIQMTAINSVGPTEAQLNLWTSPEGIEYDPISKRNVVSRYGPGGARVQQSPSKIASIGLNGFHESSTSFDANMLNSLSQWPVVIPLFLSILLVATILIVVLLSRHNRQREPNHHLHHSNNDQSNNFRSNASSTTTTTTSNSAVTSSNISSDSQQNCQAFLHPLNNHHQPLNLNGSHFEAATSSSISEAGATIAPSAFAPSEMGDASNLQGANDTYSMVTQNRHLALGGGANNAMSSLPNQQKSTTFQQHMNQSAGLHLLNDEPAYGIVGYAGQSPPVDANLLASYATNTLPMQQHLGSPPSNHGQAIIISNSMQDSMTLPHNGSSRPRNVFLCQTSRAMNGSSTLKPGNHSAQLYGILSQVAAQQHQQQRNSLYASSQQQLMRSNAYAESQIINNDSDLDLNIQIDDAIKANGKNFTQISSNATIFQNNQLIGNNATDPNTNSPFHTERLEANNNDNENNMMKQQQHYDSCFMTIVDEVARATDTLRANSEQQHLLHNGNNSNNNINNNMTNGNQCTQENQQGTGKVQLVERLCNQPDCFSLHQL